MAESDPRRRKEHAAAVPAEAAQLAAAPASDAAQRPAAACAAAREHAGLHRLCVFFESLTPESLGDIAQVYAPDAFFKDPFNEVRGVPAIEAIFRSMFAQLESPRFLIRSRILEGRSACVTWDFEFRFRSFRRGQSQTIRGASWLEFDSAGRVCHHRDYWDAAEELYEKLPVLGRLMRLLRARLAH